MRNRILTSLLATTLVTTSLLAQMHPPPPPTKPRPSGPTAPGAIGRCLEVAGLSDAQKQQARTVLETAAPALRALHEQLGKDHDALRAALTAATPDGCTVGNAMLKVGATEKAIGAENEKIRVALEAILTPEQKLRFAGCMDALTDGPKR